jgi:hypothetical protein
MISDQLLRLDFGNAQIERLQHRNEAVAGLLEILIADRLAAGTPTETIT